MSLTVDQQQLAIAELATLIVQLAHEVNYPSDGTTLTKIINRAQKIKAEMTAVTP